MDKNVRSLELFIGPHCPYCHKVLAFMQANNIDNVVVHDIAQEPDQAERLIKVGGKRQIPCLFVNEKPLYESNDIIRFLNDLKNDPERDRA